MTALIERHPRATDSGPGDLRARYDDLARRHAAELKLAQVAADGGGIAGLVRAVSEFTADPLWLIDPQLRVVARSSWARGSDFTPPNPRELLAVSGPIDLTAPEPVLVPAQRNRGIDRRHLLVPVARGDRLFAWLIVAEVSALLTRSEAALAARAAFHIAGEYALQRRVAGAFWNARSALARHLVRGTYRESDLAAAAEYLKVRADADRVIVYIAGGERDDHDEEAIRDRVARELRVEVLCTRGTEGVILLVEAPGDQAPVAFVQRVKDVVRKAMAGLGQPDTIVGVSAVAPPSALQRCYRETREVVQCVDRFARGRSRVIAVDDLGPARLFVANSDVAAVRRYVRDVLGPLLGDGSGLADLLRTLQSFFEAGRSVRESARRLGIHENTVRLRLAKVRDLTGLDVAGDSDDQLSAQTALLVLRLEGHPAIPAFDAAPGSDVGARTA